MTRILVAGNVGVDRIWRLDRKLQTGARLQCLDRVLRIGGGAANTAAALAGLGHVPLIAARIATDALGEQMVDAIRTAGLAVDGVERPQGVTTPGEILLDPDGERTLIGGGRRAQLLPVAVFQRVCSIVYVNFARLAAPTSLQPLLARNWLVAQLPADPEESRPAHGLIASRSDVADIPADALWRKRLERDGTALRFVVVTDGRHGVEIADAQGVRRMVCAAPLSVDSIGAGDFFAAGLLEALACGADADAAVVRGQAAAARFIAARPAMLRVLDPA